jgi:hypothetical protein
VRALGTCVHFMHARVCILLNIFSPKLVETFLGSQKRARHNLFLCAHLRVHVMRVGARMCAFAHFWTYSLQNWWKHPSPWATCILRTHLRMHTMHAPRACVHCTHVRAHTLLDGFSPKLMETYLGSQERARHNWFVCVRLRVNAMRVGARTCAHVCVRTFLDVIAPKLVKTSFSVGYMHLRAHLRVHTMRALCAFVHCTHNI